ncbi:MAG: tripartite tricarboxylate transporter substrate binding protein [Burkholderiales bacterium]
MQEMHRLIVVVAAGLFATAATAQQFPSKQIRILVGYTAGGTADLVSRLVARSLSEKYGQQVIVDNRPSAGGLLANELTANAAPDGYTLLLANSSFAYIPSLYTKINFDTRKDFAPVALVATTQNLLVVHPAVPAKNVKELIALAKKKRGGLNYASAGIGGSTHLATALFMSLTQTEITQIPYKGNSQSITDLISGEVDMTIAPIPVLLPPVHAGKLRALATTGDKRSPIMPDVPTIAESGVPGYAAGSWYGYVAPAKTPPAILRKLSDDFVQVSTTAAFADQLKNNVGAEPDTMPAEKFGQFIAAETEKWAKVIKATGITVK